MSTLLVLFPQRQRLRATSVGAEPESSGRTTEFDYVLSPDGLAVASTGRCVAALLPSATTVVGVVADTDLSWHRIVLPRAPASRLKAALVGVLEDALLEDADDVHLAVAPGAIAGTPTWIAAVSRRWLRGELAALEDAEVFVDRVVPMGWPDDPPLGHFAETTGGAAGSADGVLLVWAHADGVANVRLQGALARALVPSPPPPGTRWSATPGAAAAAESWLGVQVPVLAPSDRLLRAGRSLWNLRQFELARRTRGGRALRDSARRFFSPEWRPVRWGVAAFAVAQIVGLNLWAWHQRGAIEARREAMQTLVRATYPRVGTQDIQRDASAVMQREAQSLRTLAGKPGETDLEPMLLAAAAAWPADRQPVDTLRFEAGKLTLGAAGWSREQVDQFRSTLRASGWQVDAAEGRLTLTRARTAEGVS